MQLRFGIPPLPLHGFRRWGSGFVDFPPSVSSIIFILALSSSCLSLAFALQPLECPKLGLILLVAGLWRPVKAGPVNLTCGKWVISLETETYSSICILDRHSSVRLRGLCCFF